ncbi:MAG: hemin uptake protein HemP [Candidatus Methylomirabilales bacterium]
MATEIPPKREGPGPKDPRPQRRRIQTADLMQEDREIILLHQREENVLRVTKIGKLILTK